MIGSIGGITAQARFEEHIRKRVIECPDTHDRNIERAVWDDFLQKPLVHLSAAHGTGPTPERFVALGEAQTYTFQTQ